MKQQVKVKYRNSGKKFDDEGEEILLRGSGYWGLDSSIIKDIPVDVGKIAPEISNRASLSSSSSIRVNQNIAMGVANFHKELEEFELIERELENLTFNDATLAAVEDGSLTNRQERGRYIKLIVIEILFNFGLRS